MEKKEEIQKIMYEVKLLTDVIEGLTARIACRKIMIVNCKEKRELYLKNIEKLNKRLNEILKS